MLLKIIKNLLWLQNYDISKIDTSFDIKNFYAKLIQFDNEIKLKKFGPKSGDGSYYLPIDILNNITEVISFGVGPNYEFEEELAQIPLKIRMFDASVDIQNPKYRIEFTKKYVKPFKSEKSISINDIFNESLKVNKNSKFLLKMDIEGDEYANLLNIEDQYLEKIEIIVLELHYLNRIADKNTNREAYYALNRLLNNFKPIYNTINEISSVYKIQELVIPKYLEITLIKK